VSEYVIPEPEPKEIDEKLAIELRHLADNAVLKAKPQGAEQCENCRYYFEKSPIAGTRSCASSSGASGGASGGRRSPRSSCAGSISRAGSG
jgi:hypothetical protein